MRQGKLMHLICNYLAQQIQIRTGSLVFSLELLSVGYNVLLRNFKIWVLECAAGVREFVLGYSAH